MGNEAGQTVDMENEGLDTELPVEADFNASDYVTPELSAKFDEVFGKASARDRADMGSDDGEQQPRKAAPTNRQRVANARDAEAAELEEQEQEEPAEEPEAPAARKPAGAAQGDANAPAVDPMLRRAAKLNGYTDEDVDQLFELNPELAERTFGRFHEERVNQSMRFAQLAGQQQAPGFVPANNQPTPAQAGTGAAPAALTSKLDELFANLDKFGEANGEELVEKLIKPLKAEIVEPFRQMREFYESQQREMDAQQVASTFKGFEGDWSELYGKGVTVTPDQRNNRLLVCQVADQLAEGAKRQGIRLSIAESIERAHDLFTVEHQRTNARREISRQVQTRATRVTARPTQRRIARTVGEGANKSESAASEAVANWWADRGQVVD